MRLGATPQALAISARMSILATISILAAIWFEKDRQTVLSDAGALLGLGLVVGIAVLADKGCCASSTCWST